MTATSETNLIPCLPDTAPFTPEQRAYLNGFFAGMFSRAQAAAGLTTPPPAAQPLAPLSILFGSQTGNAENLAKRIAKAAGQRGFAGTVYDLSKYPVAQLPGEKHLLIVTSTYGDGEPPDNAKQFWDFISGATAPNLSQARYSICALGDSNYPKFCGFGKDLDSRLKSLGAQRVHARADCDVDFEEPFSKWLEGALGALAPAGQASGLSNLPSSINTAIPQTYSRANPFPAVLITNRPLNGAGSEKETRHFEIALEDPALNYEVGDALGVMPANCPDLVEDILGALQCSGEESVPGSAGTEITLREALLHCYEITRIPQPLLQAMAERSGDETLKKLTRPGVNGELTQFLWGREIIDLLLAHPEVRLAPIDFIALLRKLQPRLYSIASSPKAHAGEAHLTVNIVRYESLGRRRKGICSTFLAERIKPEGRVPVFVQPNKNFRPPPNGDTPMIMVGPGTGIAPFRAFLQERRALGCKGRNWLFFGDQRAATDFMYRDELEGMLREGTLTRLSTAFSRDQAHKIYVQQRMQEEARELFAWLESGAHFYVCGDANRMAKDVEAALREILQTAAGLKPDQAAEYIDRLRTERRYQRDVY